jgi:hypothetical protein
MDFEGDMYIDTRDIPPAKKANLKNHVELLEEYNRQLDQI